MFEIDDKVMITGGPTKVYIGQVGIVTRVKADKKRPALRVSFGGRYDWFMPDQLKKL